MPQEHISCRYLEEGFGFDLDSIRACFCVHHGRGKPRLADYLGGPVPLELIARSKRAIVEANQSGGHPDCVGCPHLERRPWPAPSHPVAFLGISHWNTCNIACDYCFLQFGDPPGGHVVGRRYDILPALHHLLASGALAPHAVIDWGGGGEPTINPEFPAAFALLHDHGCTQWIHTNAVAFPEVVSDGRAGRRVGVLTSVDAGTPETYLALKGKDALERVWANLHRYATLGCQVVPKYLAEPGNLALPDLQGFVDRVVALGCKRVLIDIDRRFPCPSPEVADALAHIRIHLDAAGCRADLADIGTAAQPEERAAEIILAAEYRLLTRSLAPWLERRDLSGGILVLPCLVRYAERLEARLDKLRAKLAVRERAIAYLQAKIDRWTRRFAPWKSARPSNGASAPSEPSSR